MTFLASTVPRILVALGLLVLSCGRSGMRDDSGPTAQWPEYGGDKGGLKFSRLTQITPENVDDLVLAWEYRHGDISHGSPSEAKTSFLATPLVADGGLFFCTGFYRVIALDPETGAERWTFDPGLATRASKGPYPLSCRGLAYWSAGPESAGESCGRRVYLGTRDSELIALDAESGEVCSDFGEQGRVSLREGIGEAAPWEYYPTSPPVVVGDVVVIGALVADQLRVDAPSGVVRAFDLRSGKLRWAWDPVPPEWGAVSSEAAAKPGHSFRPGTPNVWAPMSADEIRGIIYVPTGNPSPDSYGGLRNGSDYYGSSTVALDAETGEVLWHYQFVHNDLWDYDTPAQPALFDLPGVGGGRPGLAQATKMGHLFLLDRESGEPLYPVEERPVPQEGAAPGEKLSPTQPFPTHPPPIHAASLGPEDAWGFTPIDEAYCRELIGRFRSQGIFTPPSLQGSIQYPGSAGGANWGGVSIDPGRGLLFVNQSHLPMAQQLIPREEFEKLDPDAAVYPDELYPMAGTPYGLKRISLLSNFGAPCVRPPWGSLTAVDLVSGRVAWSVPLGTTRDQAPFPLWLELGTPNAGGSLATASGLVFIGATTDRYLRAFASASGEEVWSARLPYTANATPITYRLGSRGRQFVVVAAGGHGWSESGDALIAYALPDRAD
ncbi:MAG: pyrroloquinoline quinone-dependent dehydrogenase [Myxococcota bacterium]|nr:pyrroloquinoline quinone-dependent dehydrogenase [Myxococcota bacterium]